MTVPPRWADRGEMTQNRSWRDKVADLVNAVNDLEIPDRPTAGGNGTIEHQKSFDHYVSQLDEAAQSGRAWWQSLLEVEEERTDDPAEAADNVRERHPGGAVAHKFVIAAVRAAWLACHDLNKRVAPVDRVRPEELVLGWLVQRGRPDLAEFLSDLVYWPIGLDGQSNWI